MEKIKEQIKTLKEKNKFLNFILNGKNSTIILLSFLLFVTIATYPNSSKSSDLSAQIQNLNQQIEEKNKIIENNPELQKLQEQVSNLQNDNQTLLDKNKKLEEEKKTLESEKNTLENNNKELNQKLEEAQKISTNTSSSNSSTTQKSPNNTSVPAVNSNSQGTTVYITKTGNKYHRSSCSYLKNSKISININDAKSEGYTACSRCNP